MSKLLAVLIFATAAYGPGQLNRDEAPALASRENLDHAELIRIKVWTVLFYYRCRDLRRRIDSVERKIICARALCA